ncbi:MAG: Do family serine endopeptidase, partial [Deltaproteobacteria bacterium]|nr:Do family serine endopeptidase [Deltaproteobacteria bacterium]
MNSALLTALISLIALLFCSKDENTLAGEKEYKIWKEDSKSAEVVDKNFNPGASFAPLVKTLKPAVVNIYTTQIIKQQFQKKPGFKHPFHNDPFEDFFGDDFFRRFFGDVPEREFKRQSLGSGFIINDEGYLLTNNHVVSDATVIKVKLDSGKEFEAKLIGKDSKFDLALLKIDTKEKLPYVPLGDSDVLEVGDWVIAIGNPFGLSHTVTAGIVSAKDRVIGAGPYDDFIQTDASINPGNSGGPLFNAKGEAVGINTAIHAAGQGIGFAVPVNLSKSFIKDILTKGKIVRGWLGVGIQPLTEDIAATLQLKTADGALISQVFENGPAQKSGIETGDVIVEFNGKKVSNETDLTRLVGLTEPGTTVKIKLIRDQGEKEIEVRIDERKEGEEFVIPGSPSDKGEKVSSLGMKLVG